MKLTNQLPFTSVPAGSLPWDTVTKFIQRNEELVTPDSGLEIGGSSINGDRFGGNYHVNVYLTREELGSPVEVSGNVVNDSGFSAELRLFNTDLQRAEFQVHDSGVRSIVDVSNEIKIFGVEGTSVDDQFNAQHAANAFWNVLEHIATGESTLANNDIRNIRLQSFPERYN